jgi:hypothetical protein
MVMAVCFVFAVKIRISTPASILLEVQFGQMARQGEYVGELQAAIQLKYQCTPTHRQTVFVHEKTKKNETVWSGYVEVFDLTGHPEAQTCYAWRHIEAHGVRIFTLLGNQIINSAQRAIQAAIFVDAQPLACKYEKDLELLYQRIWETKKNLYDAEIRTEDLEALIQAAIQVKENIRQRRKPET